MRGPPTLSVLLCLVLSGCLGAGPLDPAGLDPDPGLGPVPAILLSEPVVLTAGAGGFEPSIAVGPDGTVYVTAATTRRPGETDPDHARLASWLWYSRDGASWHDLPSPAQVHERMFGAEGDLAVDGLGRLYFVDTYLADNTLSRWSPTPSGPAWDSSRPVQGTGSPMDDRPWLTAHGDGVVYLVSNNGASAPAPEDLLAGETTPAAASKWLHRSEDGGATWGIGRGLPASGFCMPAADPTDDHDLIVACNDGDRLVLRESRDRGRTWTTPFEAPLDHGAAPLAPGAAVDRAGTRYAVWLDDDAPFSGVQDMTWRGSEPGRVRYAHAADDAGAWSGVVDVTPLAGRFGMLHAAAGGPGVLAVAFYHTPDLTPDDESAWTAHLMLSLDADAPEPTWRHAVLLDAPSVVGAVPPRDFFQVAVGPDDAVHVAVQRDRVGQERVPGDGIAADVLYVRAKASG